MIYIIERIWIDTLENQSENAVGYEVIGYVNTKAEAESMVTNAGYLSKKKCWAMDKDMPIYRYKELKQFEVPL